MPAKKKIKEYQTAIFLEELQKRVTIPEGQYEKFLALWEPKQFKRNEFILKAGEVPKFSMFVLKGCMRQYILNEKGEESIVLSGRAALLGQIVYEKGALQPLSNILNSGTTKN